MPDNMSKIVGFIGLGKMGSWMAKNLLKRGASLSIYDTDREALDQLQAFSRDASLHGRLQICSGAKDVPAHASTIITMLPADDHLRQVYLDRDVGLLRHARPGSLLVDSSTVSPRLVKTISKEASQLSIDFLDAPVSGGVMGAENATLTFMVGGPEAAYERAKSTLSLMGRNIVHCGASGNGQIAKLCNNMLLAISMLGACEVLHLGKRLGMDPALLSKIINTSTGRCWSTEVYSPVPGVCTNAPASKQYEPGFTNLLLAKDLGLAMEAAAQSDAHIYLGSLARQLVKAQSRDPAYALKDFSVFYEILNNDI